MNNYFEYLSKQNLKIDEVYKEAQLYSLAIKLVNTFPELTLPKAKLITEDWYNSNNRMLLTE